MKKIATFLGCLAALAIVAMSVSPAALAQSAPGSYLTGSRYQMGGLLVGVISPAPSGSSNFPAVRNTYDSNRRLSKVETGVLASWQADTVLPVNWAGFTVSRVQTIAYDADGRKIQDTFADASGTIDNVTQYSYDAYNRLQCTAVRMNPAAFTALPASACTLSTQSASNGPDRITETVYDSLNNVTQVLKAYGTSLQEAYATYSYTVDNLVQYEIDANGNKTLLSYDGFDRVQTTTFPSKTAPTGYNPASQATALSTAGGVDVGDVEKYTYDSNGNRLTFQKRDGTTISYTYDALNRMQTKTPPSGNPVYYTYDNRNLVLSQTYSSASGSGTYYTYDFAGRKLTETNSTLSPSMSLSFLYDNDGDRTKITWPDAYYVAYGFDGVDRMVAACENGSFNGNPASPGCSSGNQLSAYSYDALQRIAAIQYGAGSPAAKVNYAWSSWNDLQTLTHTLASSAGTSYTDSYNPAHQIQQATISTTAYQYASANSATTSYAPNGLNEYATVGGQTPTYDANGNLTFDGTYTYIYDSENRLVGAAISTSMSATYTYDPAGRRTQKAVTGGTYPGTTQFLSAGDDEIADYNGSTLLHRYIPGRAVDQPIAEVDPSNNKTYFHQDKTGSTVAMSNASGASTEGPYTYDAYGNCLIGNAGGTQGAPCSTVAAPGVAYKYTGRRIDLETGLYYYRARFYSPALGRFLQTDPIGYKDNMDLYAYVGDDPLDKADPTGTQEIIIEVPVEELFEPEPAPFVPENPRSPESVDKRMSEFRRDLGMKRVDPKEPIPSDPYPHGKPGGPFDPAKPDSPAKEGTPHETGERNVNPNEEHSIKPKGGPRGGRVGGGSGEKDDAGKKDDTVAPNPPPPPPPPPCPGRMCV